VTKASAGLPAVGRLYVVATPIGNLGDLSPRARSVLSDCALIAAEDTRHTGILLKHFGIGTPQISLHDHNEGMRAIEIIARLREGKSIALVSDAGTPAISDPGFELVRAVAAAGIDVIAIPRTVCGDCRAVDRRAADRSVYFRGVFAGARRGAAAAAEVARTGIAHAGDL
jgi:16S rRNA (cytidine1402-2'-O)-methyltransferase